MVGQGKGVGGPWAAPPARARGHPSLPRSEDPKGRVTMALRREPRSGYRRKNQLEFGERIKLNSRIQDDRRRTQGRQGASESVDGQEALRDRAQGGREPVATPEAMTGRTHSLLDSFDLIRAL